MERHQITGHTELIGLLAYPIRHSQSPATHNAAYEKLGVDIVNLAFEVDAPELEDAIKGLRALKLRGANVSMPNKTIVHQYLDEISPAAKLCGAVNTIVNKDGYLVGHITDGIGFMQALKDNDIDVIGKKMTIAGAGGAATAIEIQAALDSIPEGTAKKACEFALRRVGYPYSQALRHSGTHFDCSSLVYYAWLDAGVDISYGGASTAGYEAQGLAEAGKTVVYEEMQPGDLIFFGRKATAEKRERVVHVAIYLGDKKFIHSQGDVHVSSFDPADADFDEYNLNRLLYAVRVLPSIDKEETLNTTVTNPYYN